MSEYTLQTKELTKQYQETKAINNVNIQIKRGEIYGLIGRNGAGKTTLMRIIAGLIKPTSGSLKLFEQENLEVQRRRLGASIEYPALYYNMTARENLEVTRRLFGIPDKKRVNEILKIVGLEKTKDKKIKNFSLGMKQRLEIGITIMDNPDFLMLDEPINGLDPEGIIELRELLLRLNQEKQITILISSHILGELSKIATYYGILNNGVLVDEFSKEELETRCKTCIKITVDDIKRATNILETVCNTQNYDVLPENTIRLFDYLEESGKVNSYLVKNGVIVNRIEVIGQDLESYFIELMGGDKSE